MVKTPRITGKEVSGCKQAEKGVQLQAEQSDWQQTRMKKLMNKSWKHITVTWQRSKRFLIQTHALTSEPLETVQYEHAIKVISNDIQHFEQSESISNTCAVETGDSNVIPDSPNMCDNDI
ncbi:hypothetical protein Tco_0065311 [Tanacetum coccineum]